MTVDPVTAGATRVDWRNWAGNQEAAAARVVRPASRDEIVATVRSARDDGLRVKAVGSGHSFTAVAVTDGVRVSLDQYSGLVSADRAERRVTVRAGMPLYRLNELLADLGLALPNLGDIDRQTVAGAIATGTHGSGARLGGLATFVEELELVTGSGEVVRCSATERPDVFAAARVGLGALGIVTEVTLRCVDLFALHADERPMPLATALAELDDLAGSNDHLDLYWFPYTDRALVKRNNRMSADEPPRPLSRFRGWLDDELLANQVYGMVCGLGRRLPRLVPRLNALSARALSARTYSDRSDRVLCSPRRVRFVEMEYGIPRAALAEAFAGLQRAVSECGIPVAFPIEVRVAAADNVWLSTAYDRDSAYLAVHQYAGMPYQPYFDAVEQVMIALDGRPHWGKLHSQDASMLRSRYPRFDDFLAVRDQLDPDRLFANAYTEQVLGV